VVTGPHYEIFGWENQKYADPEAAGDQGGLR